MSNTAVSGIGPVEFKSTILSIPASAIYPSPGQPRFEFGHVELEELAASLREFGQQIVIIVRLLEDGRYEIIDGERRWLAMQLAYGPEAVLQCELRGVKNDDHQFMQSVVANFGRQGHSPIETALSVFRVSNMPDYKMLPQYEKYKRVGALFARSAPWVIYQLKLVNLPEAVRDMVANKMLHAGVAVQLASIKSDEDKVKVALQITEKRLKPPQARMIIRSYLANRPGQSARVNQPAQSISLVFANITKIKQLASGLEDMPKRAMDSALADRPSIRSTLAAKLDEAISRLQLLRENFK